MTSEPNMSTKHQRHHDDDLHATSYFAHPLNNSASQILRRTHLVAPVTAVSIVSECNRFLVGRGSELESHPLRFDETCSEKIGGNNGGEAEVDASGNIGGGNGNDSHANDVGDKDEEEVYRHRAFAAFDGSGVIHGIRYAKLKTDSRGSDVGEKQTISISILPHWSRIISVFGERKLSILYGGGIGQEPKCSSDPITPLYFAPKNDNATGGQYDHRYLRSCLTVSDLIYDVRLLVVQNESNNSSEQSILAAIGMAQNVVEIWSMTPHATPSQGTIASKIVLTPRRLRKVVCEVRCITYSLSFYGWGGGKWVSASDDDNKNSVKELDLAVAVGTPSSTIYLWNALTNEEGKTTIADISHGEATDLSIVTKPASHSLPGHDGVVFSCRFGGKGEYLASTGDDRTVRLWKRNDADCSTPAVSKDESAAHSRAIVDPRNHYKLFWSAYGHTARVWDCAFASSLGMLVSCGEDSTVRMWDAANGGRPVATMKGFNCLSVWSVDIDNTEALAIAGGNDGSAKIWQLEDQILLNSDCSDDSASSPENAAGMCSFLLPLDEKIVVETPADEPEEEDASEGQIETDQGPGKKKKKRKKKPKAKNSAQNVVGMAFYAHNEGRGRFLTVARTGKMHSLELASGSWDKETTWCSNNILLKSIDPKMASCISLRPKSNAVAIGMSRGDIVIVPLFDECCEQIHFSTAPHIALQAIKWIDESNFVTLHVKGIAVWWTLSSSDAEGATSSPPKKLAVLDMGTVGVPISIAYEADNQRLAIGDSRSNVALFDVAASGKSEENSDDKLSPLHLIRTLHDREHVNDLMFSSDGSKLISGGNNGCIAECIIATKADGSISMHKGISVPIPALTGVMKLWRGPAGNLFAGGYQSNNYVIIDVGQGCEIMNINTGGRQRSTTLDVQFGERNSIDALCAHQLAICVGRTDGETEFLIHSSGQFNAARPMSSCRQPCYYSGLSLHGEFVNGVAWIPTNDPNTSLLLSGSNDSSVKLSCYRDGSLSATKNLPTHVSCVRAVCASSHKNSTSTLLVTCGAKLITSFYLLEDGGFCGKEGNQFDPKIAKLCQNRLENDISMDHRMNAVKSIPLLNASVPANDELCHLVLAGDSDGGLHLFIVSEDLDQPKAIAAHMLCTDSRPVLCIDIVRISDEKLVACVGDTSGQVSLWSLPGKMPDGDFSKSPFFTFNAHQCGTNCISALLEIGSPERADKSCTNPTLVICSGGDDEAIALWSGELSSQGQDSSTPLAIDSSTFIRRDQASSSALKGIKLVGSIASGYRIYGAGYDQRLSLWSIEGISTNNRNLVFKAATPVDVSDINCLDAMTLHAGVDRISIGGEGTEILSVDSSISAAAAALHGANYILITCGAGMSADSGLATYECMPEEYRELCDPSMLVKDPNRFQSFWRSFTATYSKVKPHSGYEILNEWCGQGKLKNLCVSRGNMSSCWVYSSNVDGHFRGFPPFCDCVCEIHGFGGQWRCADAIGRDQGSNRTGTIWEDWNNSRSSAEELCSSTTFSIDEDASGEGIHCKHCGRLARPNVLLFHDTDENVLDDISLQRERYQHWEAKVEDAVVNEGKALVILELGCGLNVPAVREESEEVFSDCLERMKSSKSTSSGSITLIRINPRDAEISTKVNGTSGQTISIYAKAEGALNMIDALL